MSTIAQMTVKLFADTSQFVNGMSGAGSASVNAARALESSAIAAQKEQLALDKAAVAVQVQTERLARMKTAAEGSAEAANKNATRIELQRIRVQEAQVALAELNTKQNMVTDSAKKEAAAIEKSGDAAGKATGHMNGLAGAAGGVAKVLGAGVAIAATAAVAGIAALTAAVVGGVKAASDWGDQIDSIGDVLGTSASDSAALAVAIRGVGGNVENITTQMGFMSKGLVNAKGELGTTGLAAQKLGVNIYDASGKVKGSAQLLTELATRIDDMPDGLEKTAVMMEVFGKSGKDMSDTIHALAGSGLEDARKKAQAFGLDLGDNGVNNAIAFKRGMADIEMALQGVAVTIGSALLPTVIPLIQQFGQWAQGVMPQVAAAIGIVAERIGAFVAGLTTGRGEFGAFGQFAQQAFAQIQATASAVIEWLAANWPAISAVIGTALAGVAQFVTTYIAPFAAFLMQQLQGVVAWVQTNWPLISQVIDLSLQRIKAIVEVVAPIVADVLGGAFQSLRGIVETAIALIQGALKIGMQIAVGDWSGAWETVKATAEGVLNGVIEFLGGLPATFVRLGVQLIEGLVQGINSAAGQVITTLTGLIEQALADIKKRLGIASPSRVMAGIGANMAQGLVAGWGAALQPLALPAVSQRQLAGGALPGISTDMGRADSAQPVTINLYVGDDKLQTWMGRSLRDLLAQDARRR